MAAILVLCIGQLTTKLDILHILTSGKSSKTHYTSHDHKVPNPDNAEIFLYTLWRPIVFIFWNQLDLSASFEYLFYDSTATITISMLSVRGPSLNDQNLMSTDVRFWRIKSIPVLKGLATVQCFISLAEYILHVCLFIKATCFLKLSMWHVKRTAYHLFLNICLVTLIRESINIFVQKDMPC